MNSFFLKRAHTGIAASIAEKNHRVRKAFLVTGTQMGLARQMIRVRAKVDALPQGVWIFGTGGEAASLFHWTNIAEKSVGGFLEVNQVTAFYDAWHGGHRYEVKPPEKALLQTIDCVLLADLYRQGELVSLLKRQSYQGKIVTLYDDTWQDVPFGMVRCTSEEAQEQPTTSLPSFLACRGATDEEFSFIRRIDKVNARLAPWKDKKVIVYPAGGHTENMMAYTDLRTMQVIGFADRDLRSFHGHPVLPAVKETFAEAEGIVVSSYIFQDALTAYLESLGYGDKIIRLYDEQDLCEFYLNYNDMAPDLADGDVRRDHVYSDSEVLARAERTMNDLTRNSNYYLTYQLDQDPLRVGGFVYDDEDDIVALKHYGDTNENVAIILQGPVIYADAFTYHTIVGYLRRFPKATVILSTWESERTNPAFAPFEKLPIERVFSAMPEERGMLNVYLQVRSTAAGIARAEALGIPYVFKTRTDFRIQEKGCLALMRDLLQRHPLPQEDAWQHERLVVLPPYLDVPYYLPDYFMLGRTEDMKVFWKEGQLPQDRTPCNPEVSLFERYFQYLDDYVEEPLEDLEAYAKLIADHLVVMDQSMFRAIWRKYTYEAFERQEVAHNRFTFTDWLRRQPR